jgi:excisionase family DNA binding protein
VDPRPKRGDPPGVPTISNDLFEKVNTVGHNGVLSRHKLNRLKGKVMPNILTAGDAAEILKVSRRTVLRYLRAGELEGSKLNKEWRIKESDLDKFLEERKPANQVNE